MNFSPCENFGEKYFQHKLRDDDVLADFMEFFESFVPHNYNFIVVYSMLSFFRSIRHKLFHHNKFGGVEACRHHSNKTKFCVHFGR